MGISYDPLLVPGEETSLLERADECKVYKRRWWLAASLCVLTLVQCVGWLTFGPISVASATFYNMDGITVGIMQAYGPIAYLLFTVPVVWMMEVVGLRATMLYTGAIPLVLGTGIRCFATGPGQMWMLHVGQFLIGVAGVIGCIAPAQLSQLWFPPNERATSTAITTLANSIGSSVGFIALPLQVGDGRGMMASMYTWFGLSALAFVMILLYFPDRPPIPPSRSAAVLHHEPFLKSLRQLFRCRDYWILAFANGIPTGFANGLSGLISVVLAPAPWNMTDLVIVSSLAQFSQSSSWLGTIGTTLGVACGFAIGPLADRFQRLWKHMIVGLLLLAGLAAVWFSAVVFQWYPFATPNLWVMCAAYIVTFASLQSMTPLFIEYAADVAYPVQAGTTDGGIQLVSNMGTFIFQIIGISGNVLNNHSLLLVYLLPISVVVALLLLVLFNGERQRRHVDADGPMSPPHSGVSVTVRVNS